MLHLPHRLRLALVALVVGLASWVGWRPLTGYWFPVADDYKFMTLPGHVGIHMGRRKALALAWNDWSVRLGRLSDGVFRLLTLHGFQVWYVLLPLLVTAVAMAAGLWLAQGRRPRTALLGTLVLPTVLWAWPAITGDAVFWADAAVNYLMPLVLVLLASIPLVRLVMERPTPPRWVLVCCAPLGVLAQLMHEQASWGLFAMTVVTVALRRRSMPRRARWLAGSYGVGFLLQMSAPGMWNRLHTMDGGDNSLAMRAHRLASSGALVLDHTATLWVLVALLMALVGLQQLLGERPRRSIPGVLLVAAGVLLVTATVFAAVWMHRAVNPYTPPNDPFVLGSAQGGVLLCLLPALLAGLVGLAGSIRRVGPTAALAWAAMAGSLAPTMLTGIASPRAYCVGLVWLVLTGLGLAHAVQGPVGRRVVPLLALAMVVASTTWWVQIRPQLQRNADWVHGSFATQVHQAQQHRRHRIFLVRPLPGPDATYANAFLTPRYDVALRLYYGLDDAVTFKQVPPG